MSHRSSFISNTVRPRRTPLAVRLVQAHGAQLVLLAAPAIGQQRPGVLPGPLAQRHRLAAIGACRLRQRRVRLGLRQRRVFTPLHQPGLPVLGIAHIAQAVLIHAPVQVHLSADLHGVPCIVQGVVGPVRRQVQQLHSPLQGALPVVPHDLVAEDPLQIVAARHLRIHSVHQQVVHQHRNVVRSPGTQAAILAAPLSKICIGPGKFRSVFQVLGAYLCQTHHIPVHVRVKPGTDKRLEAAGFPELLIQPQGPDLDDLRVEEKRLPDGAVPVQRLIPLQVQDDIRKFSHFWQLQWPCPCAQPPGTAHRPGGWHLPPTGPPRTSGPSPAPGR